MCWVLHIVGREFRGRTNSTDAQLYITFNFMPFLGGFVFACHHQGLALLYLERGTIAPYMYPLRFIGTVCLRYL